MTPKSIEVELETKKWIFGKQVTLMMEETFCDILLLVSMTKSLVLPVIFPTMFSKKNMHVRNRGK